MTIVKHAVLLFSSLGLLTLTSAQSLGTKKDLSTGNASPAGPIVQPMDMVQMVLALCIVAAIIKWVLPKAIARMGKRITTPLGSTINLEESAAFGGGQLQIVTVRGKTLLLCVATSGVTCLADLTEPTAAPNVEPPAFFDVLDSADPTKAVVTADTGGTEEGEMSMEDAISLISATQSRILGHPENEGPLDRLNRLTGS